MAKNISKSCGIIFHTLNCWTLENTTASYGVVIILSRSWRFRSVNLQAGDAAMLWPGRLSMPVSLLGKNVAVDTPRQRPEITPHPVPIWLAASHTHYFAFDTRDDASSWVIRPGLLPFNPCQTQTVWDPHVLANLKKQKLTLSCI